MLNPRSRILIQGMATLGAENAVSTAAVAILLVAVVGFAGVAYYAFEAGTTKGTTTPTSASSSTQTVQTSSTHSSSESSSSSSTSTSNSLSTSTTSKTSTATTTSSHSTFSTRTSSSGVANSACGGPLSSATAHVGMGGVGIGSYTFAPYSITVVIGVNNTVQWSNNNTGDPNGAPHTVTSNSPGQFNSGNMNQGDTFTCTFTIAGTYEYHCAYHPEMIGKVIVKSP